MMFQSTPPRGGRRHLDPRPRPDGTVSIHAPAWGATGDRVRIGRSEVVSIHAPACAGDSGTKNLRGARPRMFQSTPPRGGRLDAAVEYFPERAMVSIHAPAWGATRPDRLVAISRGFNPRPRVGGDWMPASTIVDAGSFNPRPRVGGDLWPVRNQSAPTSFNPRPRMGATPARSATGGRRPGFNPRPRVRGDREHARWSRSRVSIHAPAWGATRTRASPGRPSRVSIHAPAWGATAGVRSSSSTGACFNPRPRVLGDWTTPSCRTSLAFQSTPPRGGRLTDGSSMSPSGVSIHAPAWGATLGVAAISRSPGFQSTPPREGRPERRSTIPAQLVSIHAPAWGDSDRAIRPRTHTGFNPRPRVRGDHTPPSPASSLRSFNPRPRVGGRRDGAHHERRRRFQSTPPRGGRLAGPGRSGPWRSCFNPRPRVRGDLASRPGSRCPDVSIRAPRVRGDSRSSASGSQDMFQSTPPRGGRQSRPTFGHRAGFNPRPRVGGDFFDSSNEAIAWWFQSTPPRGRLVGSRSQLHRDQQFQSTPPRRGDRNRVAFDAVNEFQSTPPREGRRDRQEPTGLRFNPRPRVRGDCPNRRHAVRRHVSIHAPAWGRPEGRRPRPSMASCFNPRPRVRGDRRNRSLLA